MERGNSSSRSAQMAMISMIYGMAGDEGEEAESRLVTNTFQPIPVQVSVTINYEIAD